MSPSADPSQRIAARVVGFCYLFAMAAGVFAESFVRGSLIASDAGQTAENILAHKGLFRAGIAAEIAAFLCDATLVTALYVVLSPVNRHLALYAAVLRYVAVAVSVAMVAHSFDVLRFLSGASYLEVFESDQLSVLARTSLAAHGASYLLAFVFLGLGSAVFAYLWLESGLVPRGLALLGIVASISLAAGSLLVLVVPGTAGIIDPWYMMPMGLFEIALGGLLLVRGVHLPAKRTEL